MAKRDPYDVLGVDARATPTQIKAAWRRLARTNHPDLTGDDPAASRMATRRMAEINDAYAALTRDDGARGDRARDVEHRHTVRARRHPHARRSAATEADPSGHRPGGHERRLPAAQPGRPATAPAGRRCADSRRRRTDVVGREPLRASTPTGPLVRDRVRNFRRPPAPSLEVAEATVMPFGKFHDHTLGQIAAFEPSYIDWVAGTVNHDPDLVSAARVIQRDLDRRGVVRRAHPVGERKATTRSA